MFLPKDQLNFCKAINPLLVDGYLPGKSLNPAVLPTFAIGSINILSPIFSGGSIADFKIDIEADRVGKGLGPEITGMRVSDYPHGPSREHIMELNLKVIADRKPRYSHTRVTLPSGENLEVHSTQLFVDRKENGQALSYLTFSGVSLLNAGFVERYKEQLLAKFNIYEFLDFENGVLSKN